MIEEIKTFIESFFVAEQKLLTALRKPNLENYNKEVDIVDTFSTEELQYAFGTKMDKLRDEDFYERVKDWPSPQKRFLFRIDEYKTPSQETIFLCFGSRSNPSNKRKKYFNLFIIRRVALSYKIASLFTLSNRGMGGQLKWHVSSWNQTFAEKSNDNFLLNVDSLGQQISIHRMEEPLGHKESIELHRKDNVFS